MKIKFMELGRSMVEMLGVLAIIGVLSIVGIAGYKKAMNKIRANELMDLALKLYNERVVRDLTQPATGYTSNQLWLRATGDGVSSTQNIGWEKPSWTDDNFNIQVTTCDTDGDQDRHIIIFYHLKTCDVCKEIGAMSEPIEGAVATVRLPGSIKSELSGGIQIICRKAYDSGTGCRYWE